MSLDWGLPKVYIAACTAYSNLHILYLLVRYLLTQPAPPFAAASISPFAAASVSPFAVASISVFTAVSASAAKAAALLCSSKGRGVACCPIPIP